MTLKNKRRIQLLLVVLFVAAGIRLVVVYHERGRANATQPKESQQQLPLAADYYVTPKRLHDYDAASLKKDLAGQPAWIKEGYRYTYYPYDAGNHRGDLAHEVGTLGPIERLEVKDAVSQTEKGQQEILIVFAKDGRDYCVPVSAGKQIYADEMFFYEDPHTLYKHWPADVWDAVAKHEVRPGMNELQASFAIGMGIPEASQDPRVVRYPNGGHPLVITYQNGRATQVIKGS